MLKVESNVEFKKATMGDKAKIKNILKCFGKEIWKKNRESLVFCIRGALDDHKLSTFVEDGLKNEDFFLIQVNADLAGLLILNKDRLSGRFIQIVYIAPRYRHQGIASQAYSYAIQMLGAKAISLTLRRVLKNPDFWRRNGFKSLVVKGVDHYRYGNVVRLSVHSYPSKMSCDLDKQKIREFRKRLSEACESVVSIHGKPRLKQSHQLTSPNAQQLAEVA